MITDQDNIESEIICHILGSFQNEDPCNFLFSKQEVMNYLEKCFAAKRSLTKIKEALEYQIKRSQEKIDHQNWILNQEKEKLANLSEETIANLYF